MIFRYLVTGLLLFLLAGVCVTASPNDIQSTKNISSVPDLVSFVEEAVVYAQRYGKDAALEEFADPNGSFTRGDVYIWAYDYAGVNLAHPFHPEYKGQNELPLTDPNGFHMITAMQGAALNGSGFVTYQYKNPVTGTMSPKLAYVKRVDDTWWLGSGIYGEEISIPDTMPESVRNTLKSEVDAASAYATGVGREAALAEFNNQNGQFTTNGSYIFSFDMNGTTLAHWFKPDKIGTNEANLTDVNGMAIGKEKLEVAKNGGGFWYYVYDNPDAGYQRQFKVSYVKPMDETWTIGTGMYLPEVPVNFSSEKRDQVYSMVQDAVAYVTEHGREDAIREFNDPNGTFSHPDMFIFAFDRNGTQLATPYLPGLMGMNRINDQDPYGKFPVKQLIANAERGGGYTYYFFADPGSDYTIRLKLGYSTMAGEDMVVGAGIFSED